MNESRDEIAEVHDDALLERLRALAAQADPVPDLVLESAKAAFLMRRLDAELAELVLDSAVDAGPVLVRGVTSTDDDSVRMLSFETSTLSIEVQVTRADGARSLVGMVSGAFGTLDVETADGRRTVPIDSLGRFAVADVPAGTVRLHLVAADGTAVTTSWVSL